MEDELYKVETSGDVAIVTLSIGDFLHDVNDKLMKGFDELWTNKHKKIILDLTNTNYMSSLILASLVFIQKQSRDYGGDMVICNVKQRVQEILTMTNLDKVLNIAASREEALNHFKTK